MKKFALVIVAVLATSLGIVASTPAPATAETFGPYDCYFVDEVAPVTCEFDDNDVVVDYRQPNGGGYIVFIVERNNKLYLCKNVNAGYPNVLKCAEFTPDNVAANYIGDPVNVLPVTWSVPDCVTEGTCIVDSIYVSAAIGTYVEAGVTVSASATSAEVPVNGGDWYIPHVRYKFYGPAYAPQVVYGAQCGMADFIG